MSPFLKKKLFEGNSDKIDMTPDPKKLIKDVEGYNNLAAWLKDQTGIDNPITHGSSGSPQTGGNGASAMLWFSGRMAPYYH